MRIRQVHPDLRAHFEKVPFSTLYLLLSKMKNEEEMGLKKNQANNPDDSIGIAIYRRIRLR